MKAYVINLPRAVDRRGHMERQLSQAGIDHEFIEATDGRAVDLATPGLVASRWHGNSPLSPNVVGCALSHQEACRRIAEGGDSGAVILEDDVELPASLGWLADELAGVVVGAQVVLLNYHSAGPVQLSRRGSWSVSSQHLVAQPIELAGIGSTGAYFITHEAAERMVELMTPISGAADEWEYYFNAGGFDLLSCVTPMPIRKSADFRSTIGYRRRGIHRLGDLLETLAVSRVLLRARRRRIIERWARVELTDDPPLAAVRDEPRVLPSGSGGDPLLTGVEQQPEPMVLGVPHPVGGAAELLGGHVLRLASGVGLDGAKELDIRGS